MFKPNSSIFFSVGIYISYSPTDLKTKINSSMFNIIVRDSLFKKLVSSSSYLLSKKNTVWRPVVK